MLESIWTCECLAKPLRPLRRSNMPAMKVFVREMVRTSVTVWSSQATYFTIVTFSPPWLWFMAQFLTGLSFSLPLCIIHTPLLLKLSLWVKMVPCWKEFNFVLKILLHELAGISNLICHKILHIQSLCLHFTHICHSPAFQETLQNKFIQTQFLTGTFWLIILKVLDFTFQGYSFTL